jgi:stringent starvation protein B|tara:strand:+ start:113917 stop:114330 length:414 start_codon:yes stop_codon:yes gene_type:complete
MTSTRPYLLRAIYEWILDNQLTPHVAVNAHGEGVQVPQEHVQDGQITLNLAPDAINGMSMDNDALSFNARFRGVPMDIYVPMGAVMGVYARENGQGMMFTEEDYQPPTPSPMSPTPFDGTGIRSSKPTKKPSLRVVK